MGFIPDHRSSWFTSLRVGRMHYWIATIGALAPAIILVSIGWYWLFRQRNAGVFWTAAGLGVGVVIVTALLQTPFLLLLKETGKPVIFSLILFFVLLSLLEEVVKFAGFRATLAIFHHRTVASIGLTIGVAVVVGLTFAGIENVLFNVGIAGKIGAVFWPMLAVRAIASVPLHATCGLIMGLVWRQTEGGGIKGPKRWMVVLALPIALHVLFNVIQLVGVGFRMPATLRIDTGQWVGIAVAAILVYISAWLAIRAVNRMRAAAATPPPHGITGP